jgi:hypothetical protein
VLNRLSGVAQGLGEQLRTNAVVLHQVMGHARGGFFTDAGQTPQGHNERVQGVQGIHGGDQGLGLGLAVGDE